MIFGARAENRFRKIADVLAEPPSVEAAQDRRRIHDRITGEVEQYRTLLDHCQGVVVDHVPRGIDRRHVQRDIIRAGKQRLQVLHPADFVRQTPGGVNRQDRVKADHRHAHGQSHVGDHRADRAKPDNPERLAAKFGAGKTRFRFFHQG
jgi:hypothetical protein